MKQISELVDYRGAYIPFPHGLELLKSSTMLDAYAENGSLDLVLSLTADGHTKLLDEYGDGEKIRYDKVEPALRALLSDDADGLCKNGFVFVESEDIGSIAEYALILGMNPHEDGDTYDHLWWHDQYAAENPLRHLVERGYLRLERAGIIG